MKNTLFCGLLCVTMLWFVGCTPKKETPTPTPPHPRRW